MTSTPIARIIDRARINCSSATDGIIRLEFYNALNEFLQRSNIWLFELPMQIVRETNDYVVNTGQNVAINRLMNLGQVNSTIVLEYAPTDPPQYLIDANPQSGAEINNPLFRTPRAGVLLNAGTTNPVVRIRTNPGNEIWVATFALSIIDPLDADGLPVVPAWIIQKYQDAIGDGVISRLMAQTGKPHSNSQGAAFHGRKFNQGVGLAREEIRTMLTFGGQAWRFPGGWNSYNPRLY